MAREDDEFDEEQPEELPKTSRNRSNTERITREMPRGEPVRSDWLSSRTAGRTTRRRSANMPSSRQEFALWLQYGGWRTVAIVAAATFAAIVMLILFFNRSQPDTTLQSDPTPAGVVGQANGTGALPTSSALQPTPTVAAPQPAAPATGAQFQVIDTGDLGLRLRADHSVDSAQIGTLYDGATVTIIGEDFVGTDYVWKHLRTPDGQEGWAVTDYLQQVQP